MTLEELITAIAGALLSLGFSYIPGVRDWFDRLNSEQKRVLMLFLLAITAVGVYSLACAGYAADFGLAVACDRVSGVGLVRAFFFALFANQGAFALSPHKPVATKLSFTGNASAIYTKDWHLTVQPGYHDADDFGVGGEPIDDQPLVQ